MIHCFLLMLFVFPTENVINIQEYVTVYSGETQPIEELWEGYFADPS